MSSALVLVCVSVTSLPAQAMVSIGECVDIEAICGDLDQGCAEAISLPFIYVEPAPADPCLDEEIEGRCKDADEPETLESMDAESLSARPEPSQHPARPALTCDGSDSQCNGLPAPEQPQQLRTPIPTPYQVSHPKASQKRWALDLFDFRSPGMAPSEGVRAALDRPPQA